MRHPAYPIAIHTPDLSLWSPSDNLYDADLIHWSGSKQPILGVLHLDENSYRFMGVCEYPSMVQKECKVDFFTTSYLFNVENVELKLTFNHPMILNDLKILSRPVTYMDIEIIRLNGYTGNVKVEFLFSDKICVFENNQSEIDFTCKNGYSIGRFGNVNQEPLKYLGDMKSANSGYFYVYAKTDFTTFDYTINQNGEKFLRCVIDFKEETKINLLLAYDSIFSIEYFEDKLDCYWKKESSNIEDVLYNAYVEHDAVLEKCLEFSKKLTDLALNSSGEKYLDLLIMAYRQSIGAHILCEDKQGNVLFISKECGSGAHAATVDVTYPSMPLFLLFSPELVKGMVRPIFKFANTDVWKNLYKFAPHDAGFYPVLNGQTYPEGRGLEEASQMPIEECANMIIICYAITESENNNDFVKENFDLLNQWYNYLEDFGYDPNSQLCTDDFTERLCHNCNLSIKAIMAVELFGKLCERLGFEDRYKKAHLLAKKWSKQWVNDALNSDGTFKLTFDKKDTFSMKYNAVWDKIFKTDIFEKDCFKIELKSYVEKRIDKYGMPLDSRGDYLKSDWLVWCASMMNNSDFEKMITPLWNYYNTCSDRIPMTDLYHSTSGKIEQFRNRTVQGGLFIKLLMK